MKRLGALFIAIAVTGCIPPSQGLKVEPSHQEIIEHALNTTFGFCESEVSDDYKAKVEGARKAYKERNYLAMVELLQEVIDYLEKQKISIPDEVYSGLAIGRLLAGLL